ncbi:MAG: hypothetical protein NC308_06325 [Clostridium sp.]|nr:hypothetical protein [Bacteroides sp.]MCM1198487.1 hypothetical protein [Clostridium sp.]
MYKRILISALIMAVSVSGFSKNDRQAVSQDRMKAAKVAAMSAQDSLLVMMQRKLNDPGEANVKFSKDSAYRQFLFEDSKVSSVLNPKANTLKYVFGALCTKGFAPTVFKFENAVYGEPHYAMITKKKIEQADSSRIIVPITFEAHSLAKDNISNVKYAVNFEWEVKIEKKGMESEIVDGKKVKRYGYVAQSPKLLSSTAKPIEFLNSDRMAMRSTALHYVSEWYSHLSENLDPEYLAEAIMDIEPISADISMIKCDLPARRTFVVESGLPEITYGIDPYQFIREDEKELYTNPSARKTIVPKFEITVDKTFKKIENVNVTYGQVRIDTAKTDAEKIHRQMMSKDSFDKFANLISEYVLTCDKTVAEELASMFVAPDNAVQVSYMTKSGNEKIENRTAGKYISRLKGKGLYINKLSMQIEDSNLNRIIVTIGQDYNGNHYSDYTKKNVYLLYNSEADTYLIDKIEVVEGSTRLE